MVPTTFKWNHVGEVEAFQVKLYEGGVQLHGVQVPAASVPKVGDEYSFPADAHGFTPGSNGIPDHVDLYFTVKAVVGVDSSEVATSPVFQFRNLVNTPTNLSVA